MKNASNQVWWTIFWNESYLRANELNAICKNTWSTAQYSMGFKVYEQPVADY